MIATTERLTPSEYELAKVAAEVWDRYGWPFGWELNANETYTEAQVLSWARGFLAEEATDQFDVGCPDFADLGTLAVVIEAARALCGMERKSAAVLLRLAADRLSA